MYPCQKIKDNYNLDKGLIYIYKKLLNNFGDQNWWPGDSKFEIIIGAILTQAVNWSNVEKAIKNLKDKNILNIYSLYKIDETILAKLIKPSGYYNVKAKKIKSLTNFMKENYDLNLNKIDKGKTSDIRQKLLNVYGIGPETADSILLYAFDKPVFVIDNYTKRILSRIGYIKKDINYGSLQNIIEQNIKEDVNLYNQYHALIVKLGKDYCSKSSPLCKECPIVN